MGDSTTARTEMSKLSESVGTSPLKDVKPHAADEMAPVGKVYQLKPEKPTEPPSLERAFAQLDVPNASVGNVDFTAELKDEGKLGLFLTRDRARRDPIAVELNVANYFDGIYTTIHDSTVHLLQTKSELNDADINLRINQVSEQLTIGACLMTYLKLRSLVYLEFPDRYDSAHLRRPRAITELPVVAPFAFAIQQLGAVNIANLLTEARYVPVFPTAGHTYGVPTGHTWNPNQYAQAVEYARKIGLHFSIVDTKQKSGTAWWLLRQVYAEEVFELKLPFPEVNYTSSMALTHALFLHGSEPDPSNTIFDLTPCGTADYGYILRDPHLGINVTVFETVDESAQPIVANV